jgi:hypothetical protein
LFLGAFDGGWGEIVTHHFEAGFGPCPGIVPEPAPGDDDLACREIVVFGQPID